MTDIILCISKKGQKKRCSIVLYSILAFFLIFAFPIFPMVSSAKLVMLFIVFEILYFKNFKERIEVHGNKSTMTTSTNPKIMRCLV